MGKMTKEEQIASINQRIDKIRETLKKDLSAVHEEKLKEIQSLLKQRKEVENG